MEAKRRRWKLREGGGSREKPVEVDEEDGSGEKAPEGEGVGDE